MSNIVIEALQDKKRLLQGQLDEVNQAIKAQTSAMGPWTEAPEPRRTKKRKAKRQMSPEHREKMRQMMLDRWAAKKRKASTKRPTRTGPSANQAQTKESAA